MLPPLYSSPQIASRFASRYLLHITVACALLTTAAFASPNLNDAENAIASLAHPHGAQYSFRIGDGAFAGAVDGFHHIPVCSPCCPSYLTPLVGTRGQKRLHLSSAYRLLRCPTGTLRTCPPRSSTGPRIRICDGVAFSQGQLRQVTTRVLDLRGLHWAKCQSVPRRRGICLCSIQSWNLRALSEQKIERWRFQRCFQHGAYFRNIQWWHEL